MAALTGLTRWPDSEELQKMVIDRTVERWSRFRFVANFDPAEKLDLQIFDNPDDEDLARIVKKLPQERLAAIQETLLKNYSIARLVAACRIDPRIVASNETLSAKLVDRLWNNLDPFLIEAAGFASTESEEMKDAFMAAVRKVAFRKRNTKKISEIIAGGLFLSPLGKLIENSEDKIEQDALFELCIPFAVGSVPANIRHSAVSMLIPYWKSSDLVSKTMIQLLSDRSSCIQKLVITRAPQEPIIANEFANLLPDFDPKLVLIALESRNQIEPWMYNFLKDERKVNYGAINQPIPLSVATKVVFRTKLDIEKEYDRKLLLETIRASDGIEAASLLKFLFGEDYKYDILLFSKLLNSPVKWDVIKVYSILEDLYNHEDPGIREIALKLMAVEPAHYSDTLLKALSDKESKIRIVATKTLLSLIVHGKMKSVFNQGFLYPPEDSILRGKALSGEQLQELLTNTQVQTVLEQSFRIALETLPPDTHMEQVLAKAAVSYPDLILGFPGIFEQHLGSHEEKVPRQNEAEALQVFMRVHPNPVDTLLLS